MSYGVARIVYFSRRVLLALLTLAPTMAVAQVIPKDPNEPNHKPSQEHKASSKDVKEKLEKSLDHKNAAYEGSNIQVAVDNQNVTLTGTVTSELQHEMALQLARAYGEDRNIVDQLKIQE